MEGLAKPVHAQAWNFFACKFPGLAAEFIVFENRLASAGMEANAGNLESLVLAGELDEPAKSHPK